MPEPEVVARGPEAVVPEPEAVVPKPEVSAPELEAVAPQTELIMPGGFARSVLVEAADSGQPELTAAAVRLVVKELARRRPGRSVELRVPPYAAAQLGGGGPAGPGGGPRHRRGTPPAVVECDPATCLALAAGRLSFTDAVAAGRLTASGAHCDLSGLFPL